jgi:hypothetical protein
MRKIAHYTVGLMVVSSTKVFAAGIGQNGNSNLTSSGSGDCGAYTCLKNPLSTNTFSELLSKIIDLVLFLATPFLVLAFIYVGFQFVMAQGKPAAIENAKKNLWYTLLGAAIIIGVKLIQSILEGTIGAITG